MDSIEIEQKLDDLGYDYNRAIELGEERNGCTNDEFDKYVEEINNVSQKCVTQEKVINTGVSQDVSQDVSQKKADLHIRIDEDLKKEIQFQAKELGMSVSDSLRDVLTQFYKPK